MTDGECSVDHAFPPPENTGACASVTYGSSGQVIADDGDAYFAAHVPVGENADPWPLGRETRKGGDDDRLDRYDATARLAAGANALWLQEKRGRAQFPTTGMDSGIAATALANIITNLGLYCQLLTH